MDKLKEGDICLFIHIKNDAKLIVEILKTIKGTNGNYYTIKTLKILKDIEGGYYTKRMTRDAHYTALERELKLCTDTAKILYA